MTCNIKKYGIGTLLLLSIAILVYGCKDFTDVAAPSNQLSTETVFSNNATLNSAIAGMYSKMVNAQAIQTGLSALTSMCADDMTYPAANDYDGFVNNSLPVNDATVANLWAAFYSSIYQANSIIYGIQNSAQGALSDSIKQNATAEAKFIRAFCYFYLTNLWGDVPLALTTDAKVNNSLTRSSQSAVYTQIIKDLVDAKNNLRKDYFFSSSNRTRVNKYGAMALLSRVYLYNKDWKNAENYADSVIEKNTLYNLLAPSAISGIFVQNNQEAIWQLSPSSTITYTSEGTYFQLVNGKIPYYAFTDDLIKSFSTGDNRLNWIGTRNADGTTWYYPLKYKQNSSSSGPTEYVTFLRLAELYLIRAEARNNQENTDGALFDLDVIRNRAGLGNFNSSANQQAIDLEIEKECRLEFFAEYGHRWFDLKRRDRADSVLGAQKSGWKSTDALWPIPSTEITNNHNLTQNSGYN
jgi:starch-binding outer membrane protein, SusD/RagB family